MKDKSITELTELILKQNDMIANKNTLLRQAFDTLTNIRELSTMCKGVDFFDTDASNVFIRTTGETLRRLTLNRFDFIHESNIALPEAEEADEPTIDNDEEVTENDLPFC